MRTRTPRRPASAPADSPAAVIAAEVAAALASLRRAVAAGKAVHDDVKLELVLDDLGVIASDLVLVARDLSELAK